MLNKLDLKLFETLDSEIDKSLREGCYVLQTRVAEFGKVIHCFGEENELGGVQIGEDYFIDTTCNIRNIDGDNFKEDYEIIGQYPTTNTVLRYCEKKGYDDLHIPHYRKAIGISKEKCDWHYELDITKEIKDYTDEQKQELIKFLEHL